jgi:hypothetical protein
MDRLNGKVAFSPGRDRGSRERRRAFSSCRSTQQTATTQEKLVMLGIEIAEPRGELSRKCNAINRSEDEAQSFPSRLNGAFLLKLALQTNERLLPRPDGPFLRFSRYPRC